MILLSLTSETLILQIVCKHLNQIFLSLPLSTTLRVLMDYNRKYHGLDFGWMWDPYIYLHIQYTLQGLFFLSFCVLHWTEFKTTKPLSKCVHLPRLWMHLLPCNAIYQ